MSEEQIRRMHEGKGFIAALDQSGGSTPKALKNYGIMEDRYQTDEEMFDLVHEMRTRIITSPSFTSEPIFMKNLQKTAMLSGLWHFQEDIQEQKRMKNWLRTMG